MMLDILHRLVDANQLSSKFIADMKSRFKGLVISPDGVTGVKEDLLFVYALQSLAREPSAIIRIATKADTDLFAMNDVRAIVVINSSDVYSFPVGAQGTLNSITDVMRVRYLELCPEMKLFFPVLHNPGCFGADPDPVRCFAFLCAYGGLKCSGERSGTFLNHEKVSTKLTISPHQ
jgi:hypothetical protein